MYSSKKYKYRDSYVLYKPTVQQFGSLLYTHTLLAQKHTGADTGFGRIFALPDSGGAP